MSLRKRSPADNETSFSCFFVLMGVSGCGKSTVGAALETRLQQDNRFATFIDADDLHPKSNLEKMSTGVPLIDEDRWPWLADVARAMLRKKGFVLVACSALKKKYREHLLQLTRSPVTFIHLYGPYNLVLERIVRRKGHFMPIGLLKSQFDDLEEPQFPESFIRVDLRDSLDEVVLEVYHCILSKSRKTCT